MASASRISLVFLLFLELHLSPEIVFAQTCTPGCRADNDEVCRGACIAFTAGTVVGADTQCADQTGASVNCVGTASYVLMFIFVSVPAKVNHLLEGNFCKSLVVNSPSYPQAGELFLNYLL